jgi:hypothetical protein
MLLSPAHFMLKSSGVNRRKQEGRWGEFGGRGAYPVCQIWLGTLFGRTRVPEKQTTFHGT